MTSASSRSAKRPAAKRISTSRPSKTIDAGRSAKKRRDVAEHPETDLRHMMRGIVRRGLKPVQTKTSISLRIENDVLEWFKAQGPGYQTRMNAVLRAFRDASI
jgi:uncharacterized protein (DUF4415 family)